MDENGEDAQFNGRSRITLSSGAGCAATLGLVDQNLLYWKGNTGSAAVPIRSSPLRNGDHQDMYSVS